MTSEADARNAERAVLTTVALATVLAPLNSTMIAVALPRIMRDFDEPVSSAGWLVTGYLVALAALQPLAGRLGDRFGRRPLMLWGLVAFGLASVGAALAPDLWTLIGFRVGQAAAGAIVFPNGAGLVRAVVPAVRRARGFGIVGAVVSLAAAVGPPIGGGLIAAGGWRAIFTANVPLVLLAVALTLRYVPRGGEPGPETVHARWLGIGFFRRRVFAAAAAGIALSNLAFYVTLLAVPILLSRRGGWSSADIGLVLGALAAPAAVLSTVGGRLADRFGRRAPALAGNVALTLGLLPLAIEPARSAAALVACLGLAGAGVGLAGAALQTSAVEAVGAEQAGSAAGLYSTSRYLGSIAGSLALSWLVSGRHGVGGFEAVFVMVLAAAFGSAVVTLGLSPRRHMRENVADMSLAAEGTRS